ncbi:unnamed protein product [Trypanosoma congolense IL3000]|uniref:WGS project CAEQ00000000 data, annotated contig 104 n=1 Tax=Trypanosoma congolense (strain IL3000) TaxID=1068625 RepID=F9W3F3_TRYCI|nr:unnamed protein product [Trypanosoma congolense IL3000]
MPEMSCSGTFLRICCLRVGCTALVPEARFWDRTRLPQPFAWHSADRRLWRGLLGFLLPTVSSKCSNTVTSPSEWTHLRVFRLPPAMNGIPEGFHILLHFYLFFPASSAAVVIAVALPRFWLPSLLSSYASPFCTNHLPILFRPLRLLPHTPASSHAAALSLPNLLICSIVNEFHRHLLKRSGQDSASCCSHPHA